MARSKTQALLNAGTDGVRITNPSLEDTPEYETILRGGLDIASLPLLKIDKYYQRELLSPAINRRIQQAIVMGADLPDITLGMRGDRFTVDTTGAIILLDKVYVVDGQQRVGMIQRHLQSFPADSVRIGAKVHFNTTVEREEVKFTALNLFRTNMSTNVALANERHRHDLVAALYGLVMSQQNFVMCHRVCWQQQKTGPQLISASAYLVAAMRLHAHLAPTRGGNGASRLAAAADNLQRATSIQVVRENIATFWNLIDDSWGIADLESKRSAPHMQAGFLRTIAAVFSEHVDFWDGHHFMVPADIRKRLRALKLQDPSLAYLCGSSGAGLNQLRYVIIEQLNHRLRKKLTPRRPLPDLKAAA